MVERASGSLHQNAPVPPIVGRSRERDLLLGELASTRLGDGRLMVIGGEAGIGKTTLARDLARSATSTGWFVLIGNCYDLATPPPFGPWVDLVAGYRPAQGQPAAPESFRSGGFAGVTSRTALFSDMSDFLTRLSSDHPLVVVLEDLHWSDSESIELARHLAGVVANFPILLMITYRSDEISRDHQLYRQLPNLAKSGRTGRIDLKRLSRADLGALVGARQTGSEDQGDLIDYLDRNAEGNPFFTVELLHAIEDERGPVKSDDRDPKEPREIVLLPQALQQVIDARLARLGEDMRAPLAQAAVIGHEFNLELWGEVAGLHEERLLEIVERGVEAHLLEAGGDGTRARFVHALTREALIQSVVAPRRRIWHLHVAEAMARRAFSDPDVVAHHYERAGDHRAVEWLVRAGERAQRVYAWVSAADRFILAAAMLAESGTDEVQRAWLLYRAGRMLRIADPARGAVLLGTVAEIGERLGDPLLEHEARYSRGFLLAYADQFEEGVQETILEIDQLEALSPEQAAGNRMLAIWLADSLPEHEQAADLDVDSILILQRTQGVQHRRGGQAMFSSLAGWLSESAEVAERFVRAAGFIERPGGLIRSSTGHAHFANGLVRAGLGAIDEAQDSFERARTYYRDLDHHALAAFSYLCELHDVALTYQADRPVRRRTLARAAEEALRRAGGALPAEVSPRIALLGSLVLDGNWATAREVLSDTRPPLNVVLRRSVLEAEITIARFEGRYADAWNLVRDALPGGPAATPGSHHFQLGLFLLRTGAELAFDGADLAAVEEWLRGHDRWLEWNGAVLGRANGQLLWARWHRASGDARRARTVGLAAQALATETRQPLALQSIHRFLGTVSRSSGDVPAADLHFNTALTLASSCDAPLETLQTLLLLADLCDETGRHDEGTATRERALSLSQSIGGLALEQRPSNEPHLRPSAATPFKLTGRELEVLRLVAKGWTDAAVADELFISPRTVSQHLRSIYAKLGVASRSAATRIAVEERLT